MSHGICSCNWWSTNIGICSFTHEQLPISFSSPPIIFLRHFNQMKSTLLYLDKRSFSRKTRYIVCALIQHKAGIESAASIRGPHKMTIIVWFSNSDWWRPLAQSSPNRESDFPYITLRVVYHQRAATLTQCRRPFFLHFLSTKFVYATKPLMEIQVDCVTRCKYRIETVK